MSAPLSVCLTYEWVFTMATVTCASRERERETERKRREKNLENSESQFSKEIRF